MTKKHFIALADYIRDYNTYPVGSNTFDTHQLKLMADFCQSQNPRFNRARWLAYIAGECEPNGGKRHA